MAAGVLSKPGTKYGPCNTACKHLDCAQTRQWADAQCSRCTKPIGYDTRFYRNEDSTLVHAVCEESAIEVELQSRKEGK